MSALRRDVEALQESLRRVGLITKGESLYGPISRRSAVNHYEARAKALAHEADTLAAIVARLDKATAPREVPQLGLPGAGTVARVVLEVLHVNALGHDHDSLRDLVGLTDAELAVRVTGAGPNTVRPRRIDLVRAGWVQEAGQAGTATRWTLTAEGYARLQQLAQEATA